MNITNEPSLIYFKLILNSQVIVKDTIDPNSHF